MGLASSLGKDAYSVGPVVGMLAGALYGYDSEMSRVYTEGLVKYDQQKVAVRAYCLFKNHSIESRGCFDG